MRTRAFGFILFLLLLLALAPAVRAQGQGPDTVVSTPAPPAGTKTAPIEVRPLPTPEKPATDPCTIVGKAGCPGLSAPPGGSPGGSPGGETRVIHETRNYHYHSHQIFLSADTVSSALDGALRASMRGETEALNASLGRAAGATGAALAALRVGVEGDLSAVGRSVFPFAAALAVPLFLLRLAIFHWARLVGDADAPLRVASDWIVALFWAAASPFLTGKVAALGFEIAARVFGDPLSAAGAFQPPSLPALAGMLMLGPLLNLLVGLGYIAGIAALLWALAAGYALLYLLAVLGPIAGVARAVPHLRWLSSLWLKGVVLAALLPVAAGAVMKAATLASPGLAFSSGLAAALGRLVFLYGAVGLLFSMAGAAARFSFAGAAEAAAGTVRAAKGIIGMAVLAGGGGALLPAAGTALAGASGMAAGAGMIREGLRQEALGRALDLPALTAAGAWEREVGRLWMQAAAAEAPARFEARVIAPLYREALAREDAEGWAFRRFLEGYREGIAPALRAGLLAPPADEGAAREWQARLRAAFGEAWRRYGDGNLVGGEAFRELGRQRAAEEIPAGGRG